MKFIFIKINLKIFKKTENKEEYYEKAVKILKVIHDIKWNEKAD